MRNIILAIAWGVMLCFSLGACGLSEENSEATALWNKIITKCGDTYLIYVPGSRLTEYKNPHFLIKTKNITAADKLNDLQWNGSFIIYADSVRYWYDSGQVSDWQTPYHENGEVISFDIRKSKNIWEFNQYVNSVSSVWVAIDTARIDKLSCSSIKK